MCNFFKIHYRDAGTPARAGSIKTVHGVINTPAFIPVGTVASVKTLSPLELTQAGVQVVLGNTYHLSQQPGTDVISACGGLASFMGWNGPTVTDSGGFQVFSLSSTRKVSEEGVSFRSVYNGNPLVLTPESTLRLQREIGADFIYALDECTPFPAEHEEVARAVSLTTRWAERFLLEWERTIEESDFSQVPVLVVQGGVFEDLRKISVEQLTELSPASFAIGGLSVGEPFEEMIRIAALCCEWLPDDKPRHLMGVGTPSDLLAAVEVGVDLFDCVIPTRNGRNGQAFTSGGVVNIRNACYRLDREPLDPQCESYACRSFTRSYLHHLFLIGELLGMRLLSLHNITYYMCLMKGAREALEEGRFIKWKEQISTGWDEED